MKKTKRTYKEIKNKLDELSIDSPNSKEKAISKSSTKQVRRSKRPTTSSSNKNEIIQEIEDLDFYDILKDPKFKTGNIIKQLEEQSIEHEDIILRHFLLFFLKSFGLKELAIFYSKADALKVDIPGLIEKIYSSLEILDSTEIVFPSLQKGKTSLMANFHRLMKSVFFDSEKLVFKTKLLKVLYNWMKNLSLCKVRGIRICVLEITFSLLKAGLEFCEQNDLEIEKLKNLDEADLKVKRLGEQNEVLNKFFDNLVYDVISPRGKDISHEIRSKFLEIIQFLFLKSPKKYLNLEFLEFFDKIIGRNDETDNIKIDALLNFDKLFEKKDFEDFSDIFSKFIQNTQIDEKIFTLAFSKSGKMQTSAVQLILNINRALPKLISEDKIFKLNKMAFVGNRDSRKILIPLILKDCFERPIIINKDSSEKIKELLDFCFEIDENDENPLSFEDKIKVLIEDGGAFLRENCETQSFLKIFLEKSFTKRSLEYKHAMFTMTKSFIKDLEENKKKSFQTISIEVLKNLENLVNKFKHEPTLFKDLLNLITILDSEILSEPESFSSLQFLCSALLKSLDIIHELEYLEEACEFIMNLSKISNQTKDLAADLVNSIVKNENEGFQQLFAQIYANMLEVELLSTKKELFEGINKVLQKFNVLLGYFQIPTFLEDEFLVVQINGALQRHLSNLKSKDDENFVGLYINILGLAHYWLFCDIFHHPENISGYGIYFRIRNIYYENLIYLLSEKEGENGELAILPQSLREKGYEQAISFISLLGNDKLSKLKGIFLSTSDKLYTLAQNFVEREIDLKNKEKNDTENTYNPFPKLISLFTTPPYHNQRLLLSVFGKEMVKLMLKECMRGVNVSKDDLSNVFKIMKTKEIVPQNKETLIFWKIVQDILFEICEDHILSNTEQVEMGAELCKITLKAYFVSGEAKSDAIYLEKYLLFMADSIARALDANSNLLSFEFLSSLIYRPVFEKRHLQKLLEFTKKESIRKKEIFEEKGKKLEKAENYNYFEKFVGSLEKALKKGESKKNKKNKKEEVVVEIEEEDDEKQRESKRKEIIKEQEGRRKEMEEALEDEETRAVIEYNETSKKKKAPKRKMI